MSVGTTLGGIKTKITPLLPEFKFGKEDLGAKEVVLKFFPDPLGTQLATIAGRNKELNWRKVLEPVDAVTQCESVLSDSSKTVDCYLCGQPIWHKSVFGKLYAHPLYPECEHILPVTSARWYLDLYMSKQQLTDDNVKRMLDIEYAWAHRVCNQTKSNDLFISESNTDNTISANSAVITETLQNIKSAASRYLKLIDKQKTRLGLEKADDELNILNAIAQMDVGNRSKSVSDGEVKRIVDHVNTYPVTDAGVLTLSRATCIYFNTDSMSAPLKAAVEKFSTDGAAGATIETTKANLVTEWLTKAVQEWVLNELPDYSGKRGASRLLGMTYRGKVAVSMVQDHFNAVTSDKTTLADQKQQVGNFLVAGFGDQLDLNNQQLRLAMNSFYEFNVLALVWNRLLQTNPTDDAVVCILWNQLTVLNAMLRKVPPVIAGVAYEPYIQTLNPLLDTPEIVARCEAYNKRMEEAASKEEARVAELDEGAFEAEIDKEEGRAVRNTNSELEESFFTNVSEIDDLFHQIYDIQQTIQDAVDKNPHDESSREMIVNACNEAIARLETFFPAIIQKLRAKFPGNRDTFLYYDAELRRVTPLLESLRGVVKLFETKPIVEDETLKNAAEIIKNTLAHDITMLNHSIDTTNTVTTPFEEQDTGSSSSSSAAKQGGRRTRRAKLSQRTKRARRSGPSTKLRRRSFRKSRTGKWTKRSRY